jgi:hypothetical protein
MIKLAALAAGDRARMKLRLAGTANRLERRTSNVQRRTSNVDGATLYLF